MDLNKLTPHPGSRRKRKRVGRGESSGLGKTAGRGHKGQNSRSGSGVKAGFEGGQMPLQRRLPKRGFSNYAFRKKYALVNVRDLASFGANAVIDPEVLIQKGLIKKIYDGVKVLGDGEMAVPVTVKAHRFSKSARSKIEAAGGNAVVVELHVTGDADAAAADGGATAPVEPAAPVDPVIAAPPAEPPPALQQTEPEADELVPAEPESVEAGGGEDSVDAGTLDDEEAIEAEEADIDDEGTEG